MSVEEELKKKSQSIAEWWNEVPDTGTNDCANTQLVSLKDATKFVKKAIEEVKAQWWKERLYFEEEILQLEKQLKAIGNVSDLLTKAKEEGQNKCRNIISSFKQQDVYEKEKQNAVLKARKEGYDKGFDVARVRGEKLIKKQINEKAEAVREEQKRIIRVFEEEFPEGLWQKLTSSEKSFQIKKVKKRIIEGKKNE